MIVLKQEFAKAGILYRLRMSEGVFTGVAEKLTIIDETLFGLFKGGLED